jgi:hypothetical protein
MQQMMIRVIRMTVKDGTKRTKFDIKVKLKQTIPI